jgi:nucleotide-binding universal stress UspA family protein
MGFLTDASATAFKAVLQDELDVLAASLHLQGVRADARVVEGRPERAILEAARDDVDLIVMSTHGRGGLRRWVYGSTADAVLRQAPVPVLLVPPEGLATWATDRPMKIMAALDGSTLAEAALDPACKLADALGANLVLARIVDCPRYSAYIEGFVFIPEEGYTFIPEPADQSRLAEDQAYLEETAARLRTDTRSVEVVASYGSPHFCVASVAKEVGADVIVMATHGQGGIVRALLGSVAASTLQRTDVPLLVVRPVAARHRAELAAPDASVTAAIDNVLGSAEIPAATATVSLSYDDLELLVTAIGDQLHNGPVDSRQARPMRELLDRLRAARAPIPSSSTTGPHRFSTHAT